MLSIDDLHTYYGDSYILQGLSLEVPAGHVVALLGRNGMGKTTTIRSIIGFTRPRRGRVTFKDVEITGRPAYDIVRMGMGLVPQGRRIFPSLTVEENLTIGVRGALSGLWTLERVWKLFPALHERRHLRGGKLSGGEQSMLAIGRALMLNPDCLLMDEPTEGLSPLLVEEVSEVIGRLKSAGLSILLVEQDLGVALSAADDAYVISKGRVMFHGPPARLWADEEVKARYLGVWGRLTRWDGDDDQDPAGW